MEIDFPDLPEYWDNGPGEVECACGRLILDDDTGNTPFCSQCYRLFVDVTTEVWEEG